MLRRKVNCSVPYLPQGTHVEKVASSTPSMLPMMIAAIPSCGPTNRAVAPPMRKAQVAMARAELA
ncbi:hypothetical protein FQZ97_1279650 [compost metagenome]